jgi:hypothetical protein
MDWWTDLKRRFNTPPRRHQSGCLAVRQPECPCYCDPVDSIWVGDTIHLMGETIKLLEINMEYHNGHYGAVLKVKRID